jgi:hypothetical protein
MVSKRPGRVNMGNAGSNPGTFRADVLMRQRMAFERLHTHRKIASREGAENAEILSTTDWLIAVPGEVTHASRRSAAPCLVHAHMGTPFRFVRRVSNFRGGPPASPPAPACPPAWPGRPSGTPPLSYSPAMPSPTASE